ncbi:gephyrin-like molybdotransferase receptor GlpR [Actinokineospora guangxiensis]|uniref:Gephyrin-like molybdotransferase receptor GlpR n=1 Tax=Actinokineospora guangxiensis TaxID=1490288 RepID=A0ABW0EI58_9PSEU
MPSSLIVVALVVAWLVVLVPMVVRRRQEIARTTESTLAGRVVRPADDAPENAVDDIADEVDDEVEDEEEVAVNEYDDDFEPRRYRPGRGGFDPDAAARAARAKYAFRQRIVLLLIVAAVATAVTAATALTWLWWAHGAIDLALVGYLSYLRRQVRIEDEIRRRRLARMQAARRHHARPAEDYAPVRAARPLHPGAVVVDIDDEDPWFDDLGDPRELTYRRAVGE